MPRITATVEDRHEEILSSVDAESRSEAVRECIEAYEQVSKLEAEVSERVEELRTEYEGRISKYEGRITELEQEVERQQRERRQLLEQREENGDLVRFAKEQRSVVRQREDRERRHSEANLFRRAWWFVAGMPSDSRTIGD